MTCGKLIKTLESTRPCLCAAGHAGGCNPFSPNPYILAVTPPKRSALPPDKQAQYVAEHNVPVIDWTLRDGEPECIWQGAHGRCVLRAGHFPTVPHKENNDNA